MNQGAEEGGSGNSNTWSQRYCHLPQHHEQHELSSLFVLIIRDDQELAVTNSILLSGNEECRDTYISILKMDITEYNY